MSKTWTSLAWAQGEFMDAPAIGGGRNADVLDEVCGNPHKPNAIWSHLEVIQKFGRAQRARTFDEAFRACCTGGVRDWETFNLSAMQDCHPEFRRLQLPVEAQSEAELAAWEMQAQWAAAERAEEAERPAVSMALAWEDSVASGKDMPKAGVAPSRAVGAVVSPPALPDHAWRPAVPSSPIDEDAEIAAMVRRWAVEAFRDGEREQGKEYLRIARTLEVMQVDESMIENEDAA